MSYSIFYNKAQIVSVKGDIVVPTSYAGQTNCIIPDEIVNYCIDRYTLTRNQIKVLDPMCGIGTIPRIINEKGGYCMGVEIDESRFNAALEMSNNENMKLGNYLDIRLPEYSFDCIFTSMPFDWFKNNDHSVIVDYAVQFKKLLKQNGFVLLDSIPSVNRLGEEWPVASRQCDYLEANGFSLVEVTKFCNNIHVDLTNESVIMKFVSS